MLVSLAAATFVILTIELAQDAACGASIWLAGSVGLACGIGEFGAVSKSSS